jgi:aspartyl-tRNA synthetase
LNEATSIDIEIAFATAEDVMEILENLITQVFSDVKKKCVEELKTLNHELEVPRKPFPKITYSEALEKLEQAGIKVPWGEDLSTPAERKLGELIGGAYFIVDWPMAIKPFYTMPKRGDPKLGEAFDLMYGEIELASGGTRIHQEKLLAKRIEEKGLNAKNFEWHLQAFKYGALPPHAGFGLGLDRLTMVLTGAKNIREVVLFPRDRRRITP